MSKSHKSHLSGGTAPATPKSFGNCAYGCETPLFQWHNALPSLCSCLDLESPQKLPNPGELARLSQWSPNPRWDRERWGCNWATGDPEMRSVSSAPLPTHSHEGRSQLQEMSSQKQRDGAGWALGTGGDQGCGGFTPVPSQHGDLSPVHPDPDVGMSPDGIKATSGPPITLGAGTAAEDGQGWEALPSPTSIRGGGRTCLQQTI